jgi:hypothetical protein
MIARWLALPSGEQLSSLLKALLLRLASDPSIEVVEEIRVLANREAQKE